MSQQELLRRVIFSLEDAGIDYMVTGSVVSSLQGEPRSTHDIDLVVRLESRAVPRLLAAFPPPDFFLSEACIQDAIRSQSMFNLLQVSEGEKVDFWPLTPEPFDQSRFSRRCVEDVLGLRLSVSSPEDTILAKLRWAKLSGGSEKQFTDALRVYEVQCERLDQKYLEHWVKQLNVEVIWDQLKAEAKPL